MESKKHYVNHLQFNHDDTRLLFLHRWFWGHGHLTRKFTANPDGSDICCLWDQDMVSHFDWRNPRQILAWAHHREIGDRYFLSTDRTDRIEVVGDGVLTADGHCSYSPDGRWILTDSYAGAAGAEPGKRPLHLYHPGNKRLIEIGQFLSPGDQGGPERCDLHPRWSRDGKQVCIDSIHEGSRQVYVLDVSRIVSGTSAP